MATTLIVCPGCGILVEKRNKDINRAHRQDTRLFCSHACSAKTIFAERRKAYIVPATKECRLCHKTKSLPNFHFYTAALDGRQSYCKTCSTIRTKNWQEHNPEKFKRHLKKYRYGLTPEMEAALHIKQGGVCAICGAPPPLVVDHDHVTGATRGLLCRDCNIGLGMFKDNIDNLLQAIRYLRQTTRKKKTSSSNKKSAA